MRDTPICTPNSVLTRGSLLLALEDQQVQGKNLPSVLHAGPPRGVLIDHRGCLRKSSLWDEDAFFKVPL